MPDDRADRGSASFRRLSPDLRRHPESYCGRCDGADLTDLEERKGTAHEPFCSFYLPTSLACLPREKCEANSVIKNSCLNFLGPTNAGSRATNDISSLSWPRARRLIYSASISIFPGRDLAAALNKTAAARMSNSANRMVTCSAPIEGANARLRTHKRDSQLGRFVIQSLRRETIDGSELFLAERPAIRAARAASSHRYTWQTAGR